MILVDTSVWVSHFRRTNPRLQNLLMSESVFCHPLIIGEHACGNLHNRSEILKLFQELPMAKEVTHEEMLAFIEARRLMGKGLSIIDVHLLMSASITQLVLWTEDKALVKASHELKLSYH